MNARHSSSAIALAALLVLAGCAHAPLNRPLLSASALGARHPEAAASGAADNDLMVALFFSGGGTRAAAFSYGVLKELAATRINSPAGDYRILDKVKAISAVSGGSFTAAYYCLYRDRIFSDFEGSFLRRNITAGLLRATLNPLNWPKLMSPYYGRSDLAAEYYDRILFHGATFGDLARAGGRPFLVLNATDIGNGEQFPFVPVHFELIGSDLDSFPISRAVAAASAFPLLLSPITLKNYRGSPGVAAPGLTPSATGAEESERNLLVRNAFTSYGDYRENPYIHLVDGGASDDLGLEALIDADLEFGGLKNLIKQTLGISPPRKFVVIVVNAAVRRRTRWNRTAAVPGVASELWRLADDFGEHSDAEFLDMLKIALNRWQKDAGALPGSLGAQYYLISLDLDQSRDVSDRLFFDSLPTSFYLPPAAVDRVVEAGEKLLGDSAKYRRLVGDLGGSPK